MRRRYRLYLRSSPVGTHVAEVIVETLLEAALARRGGDVLELIKENFL
jgi:hypothetical protein